MEDRGRWHAVVHGVGLQRVRHDLVTEQQHIYIERYIYMVLEGTPWCKVKHDRNMCLGSEREAQQKDKV